MKKDLGLFATFPSSRASSPAFPTDVEYVFVADMFADEYVGGAELTLEALIKDCPGSYHRIRSSDLTISDVREGSEKYWIFGNYSQLPPDLLGPIASSLRYSLIECDFKFCRARSPELHLAQTGSPCDCARSEHGQLVASFMLGADCLWWMSRAQRDVFHREIPLLRDLPQHVLSSVFDDDFYALVEALNSGNTPKDGVWLIQDSSSWIKGTQASVAYARSKGIPFELVKDLSPGDLLRRLSRAKGLIFHPLGGDTCPRIVIEAKALGCELDLNENVLHAGEPWFRDDPSDMLEHLQVCRESFWLEVVRRRDRALTISAYVTTYDCLSQSYPLEACLESLLGFADEVVVVDGGSTDGTSELVRTLQARWPVLDTEESRRRVRAYWDGSEGDPGRKLHREPVLCDYEANAVSRVKLHVAERDWSDPRSALFDGQQKALARSLCVGDLLWQSDVDELVRPEDYPKIRDLAENFPKFVPMVSLPVVEFWGSLDKVRLDVCPWKWRISRNSPRITHGIPVHLRTTDPEGRLMAKPGTDGCDPVDVDTGEPIGFLGFLTPEMESARRQALSGDPRALMAYESWFERVVGSLPSVYHVSWLDLERKVKLYRKFWSRHWQVLIGDDSGDTSEANKFFDKPWSEVSDQDIARRASELEAGTCGWIFHEKWDGRRVPGMRLRAVNRPAALLSLEKARS